MRACQLPLSRDHSHIWRPSSMLMSWCYLMHSSPRLAIPPTPRQSPESRFPGKEGFPHFPSAWKREFSVKKSPFSLCSLVEKKGIFRQKTPFSRPREIQGFRAAIYRSLRALRAQNRKKVSKRVFLGVWRKVSKNTRKSLKIPKNTQKGPKIGIFRLFRVFFETFLQTPKKTLLETFFAISGPEGPETPVNGGSDRKVLALTPSFPGYPKPRHPVKCQFGRLSATTWQKIITLLIRKQLWM